MKVLEPRVRRNLRSIKRLTLLTLFCLSLCLLPAAGVSAQGVWQEPIILESEEVPPDGPPDVYQSSACAPSIKTDRDYYPILPRPALPPAGGKFCDPTFGTQIMRVTDENTVPGGGAGTSYSYYPTFNSDNSRLLVMESGAPQFG